MTEQAWERPPSPDLSRLVTEDDEPVDNIQSEKGQRLLVGALYASWSGPSPRPEAEGEGAPRKFLATANVGLFSSPREPPIVPDVLLSTDVAIESITWSADEPRAYFVWEHGKPPELVIEIVSNREGDELGKKLRRYGRLHVSYYAVFDPLHVLGEADLRVFALSGDLLQPMALAADQRVLFPELGLGLCLWEGRFEGTEARWLRFTDATGRLLLTGEERADEERARADQERTRADQERTRADEERARADRLAARLRALGVELE